jgi:argininosuccinate synthase
MEINKDNLEKALSKDEAPEVSKEEEIGFHKGVLDTLSKERMELFKMLQNVEAIMGAHIKRLEELGIKIKTKKE